MAAIQVENLSFAYPENLCLSPSEISRRVEEILNLLGFSHLRLRNPNLLSGGQKQLLAIGAVLALQPSILVLDEPMAQLDEKGRRLVREILLSLRSQGKTLIIVEHDLENLDFADRLLLMEAGRMICVDTPKAIMSERDFLQQHRLFF